YGDEPVQTDSEATETLPQGADRATDLVDLRLLLDAKMTWLAKHLLGGPDTPTFVTVGSLAYDNYLPEDQARRAARLLAFDPGLVDAHDPAELQSFARAVAEDI